MFSRARSVRLLTGRHRNARCVADKLRAGYRQDPYGIPSLSRTGSRTFRFDYADVSNQPRVERDIAAAAAAAVNEAELIRRARFTVIALRSFGEPNATNDFPRGLENTIAPNGIVRRTTLVFGPERTRVEFVT